MPAEWNHLDNFLRTHRINTELIAVIRYDTSYSDQCSDLYASASIVDFAHLAHIGLVID